MGRNGKAKCFEWFKKRRKVLTWLRNLSHGHMLGSFLEMRREIMRLELMRILK